MFGGLVASSAHIFSIWSALGNATVDRDKLIGGAVSALGFNNLQWHNPVRPNDVLRRNQVVLAVRESSSKPGLGIITIAETVVNQNDETVFTLESSSLHKQREAS
jgi:acyl dehydratase